MNLSSFITHHALHSPEKVALKNEESLITYHMLENTINKTANAFLSSGIEKGDRILSQIGNRFEFVYTYFAAIKCGAIIVPVNPAYTPAEISYIANDCQPTIYVCEDAAKGNIPVVQEQSKELKSACLIDSEGELQNFNDFIEDQPAEFTAYEAIEDDVCEILYTSGTTGHPKGAMLTHKGLAGNASTYKDILHCSADDICLISAPLYHAAAQTNCMNTIFTAGGTNYIVPKFSTEKVLKLLEIEKITYFFGPPSFYILLLNHQNIHQANLSLRVAFTGAAPMPVETHHQWKKVTGIEILEGYGLTECSPIVCNHRPEDVKKIGSIGRALPGVSVKIVDELGNNLPDGEVGELIVKGPNVMKGYWNNPNLTSHAIQNGWFYTGDFAYRDEDGYFYIIDRKKDMIIRGGLNVYPREVEEVIYSYPAIFEVSVVGVPDPIMGEELKAFYSLRNPLDTIDEEELKNYCKSRLAPYKVPKYYEKIDTLPKTASGKIMKQRLKELSQPNQSLDN